MTLSNPIWVFPPQTPNFTLPVSGIEASSLNASISSFLNASITDHPQHGFGSVRAYANDIFIYEWTSSLPSETEIQEWCLQCSEGYGGVQGWGACADFTMSDKITLTNESFDDTTPASRVLGYRKAGTSVSLCTFSIKSPSDNTLAFTVLFPQINNRRDANMISLHYTFSSQWPEGLENTPAPSPTRSGRWPTSTSTGYHYSGSYHSASDSNGSKSNAGVIVGCVVGLSLLGLLILCIGSCRVARERQREPLANSKARKREGRDVEMNPPNYQPTPTRRPVGQERLRGMEAYEAPPPTYSEVIRERENPNSTSTAPAPRLEMEGGEGGREFPPRPPPKALGKGG